MRSTLAQTVAHESAFRRSSRRLVESVKPARTGVASLMSIAAAALCAPQPTQAAQVIATITGTLQAGSVDRTGVFGFAPGTNLTGQNFTVVYAIDDTKGTQGVNYNSNGVPDQSCIENYSDCVSVSNTTNPMTAVLTINGHSYSFGGGISIQSSARRYFVPVPMTVGADQLYFYLSEYFGSPYETDNIQNNIMSASTTFTVNYNWESPLSYAGPLTTSITSFNISRTNQSAFGYLIAESISISGPIATGTPPSLLQLAYASEYVYSGNSAPPGYIYWADSCAPNCSTSTFRAAAYVSTNGMYVIFAFRGTVLDPAQNVAMLKSFQEDASFIGGKPSTYLEGAVTAAASFVNSEIASLAAQGITPKNVYLTGHSLGGAIAQMLSQKSTLNASVFDAPGSAEVYESLGTQLSDLQNYGVGGSSRNYRLYGDQFSLIGTQFSTPITIPNISPNSAIDGLEGIDALVNTFYSHRIGNMIFQVAANAQNTPETSSGPDVVAFWEAAAVGTVVLGNASAVALTVAVNQIQTAQAFDPPAASDYVFATNTGSPLFSCAILPTVDGVASWNIRSEVGSTWSAFKTIPEGGQVCFGSTGASAIEFQPYGPSGANIVLPDSLLFLTTFTKTGTFSGTLTASGTVAAAAATSVAPALNGQ
jgi:Lipase (class 3)